MRDSIKPPDATGKTPVAAPPRIIPSSPSRLEPVTSSSTTRSASTKPSLPPLSVSFSLVSPAGLPETNDVYAQMDSEIRARRIKQILTPQGYQESAADHHHHCSPNNAAGSSAMLSHARILPSLKTTVALQPLFVSAGASGAAQRRQVMLWASNFSRAAQSMMPAAVSVSIMHAQIKSNTSHLPQPSSLRVAASFWLLSRICASLETNADAVSELLADVETGLFMPSRDAENTPKQELSAQELHALGMDPSCGIHNLLSHKTYFEAYLDIIRKLEDTAERRRSTSSTSSQRQLHTLDSFRRKSETLLKRMVFSAWRGVVRRERYGAESISKFAKRHVASRALTAHFYAWRLVAVLSSAQRTIQRATEGADALITTEALTHTRGVELETQNEELRLVVARLKAEKSEHEAERTRLKKSFEVHVNRGEHWRGLAVTALDFLGRIKPMLTAIQPVAAIEYPAAMELASDVIFSWVESCATDAAGGRLKCRNFGPDLRDGSVYVVLMHSLAPEMVSLDCLSGHKDVRRRFQICLDAMGALGLKPLFGPSELVLGNTDANFATLFTLWWHYATPPGPPDGTCLAHPGSFHDDAVATREYLEQCSSHYPQWLHHRAVLMQLLLYVLQCRARGTPVKVAVAEELKQAERDMSLYGIPQGKPVPGVFVELAFMTAHHKALNEEERQRINEVVQQHVGLLKSVYSHYADVIDSSNPAPKGRKLSEARSEDHLMSFVGFYRFCVDCKVIAKTTASGADHPPPTTLSGQSGDHSPAPRITKSKCFEIFKDCIKAFTPSITEGGATPARNVSKEATLTPVAWIAACARVAVLQLAPHALTISTPAPGASSLLSFITQIIAPFACVSPASAFEIEFWGDAVQSMLRKRRKIILPFFEHYTGGNDGNGTMSFDDLSVALAAVPGFTTRVTQDVLRSIFAQLTGVSSPPADPRATPENPGADPISPRSEELDSSRRSDDDGRSPALVYGEFEMLLLAIGVYENPSPFMSLAEKAAPLLEVFSDGAAADLKRIQRRLQTQ